MGNILSAIRDDINEYKSLCEQFNEPIQYSMDAYGYKSPDCYGKHAQTLTDRNNKKHENRT